MSPGHNCEDSPISNAFRQYAAELDLKHDRHERIVKMSRDITIESKRIIFLLHTIDARKNREKILAEAQQRLTKLTKVNFCAIAKELRGQDVYQFRSAYSPGLQEFIEAYTFMEYMKLEGQMDRKDIIASDWEDLQKIMQYEEEMQAAASKEQTINKSENETDEIAQPEIIRIKFNFHIEPSEYILGLSDLTGELMRRCINSLGSGETETCLMTCKVLQQFYTGYISLNSPRARDLWRKISVMRQSVLKAENVCYNVKVRGGEAAKWGAVFEQKPNEDVDEGFY